MSEASSTFSHSSLVPPSELDFTYEEIRGQLSALGIHDLGDDDLVRLKHELDALITKEHYGSQRHPFPQTSQRNVAAQEESDGTDASSPSSFSPEPEKDAPYTIPLPYVENQARNWCTSLSGTVASNSNVLPREDVHSAAPADVQSTLDYLTVPCRHLSNRSLRHGFKRPTSISVPQSISPTVHASVLLASHLQPARVESNDCISGDERLVLSQPTPAYAPTKIVYQSKDSVDPVKTHSNAPSKVQPTGEPAESTPEPTEAFTAVIIPPAGGEANSVPSTFTPGTDDGSQLDDSSVTDNVNPRYAGHLDCISNDIGQSHLTSLINTSLLSIETRQHMPSLTNTAPGRRGSGSSYAYPATNKAHDVISWDSIGENEHTSGAFEASTRRHAHGHGGDGHGATTLWPTSRRRYRHQPTEGSLMSSSSLLAGLVDAAASGESHVRLPATNTTRRRRNASGKRSSRAAVPSRAGTHTPYGEVERPSSISSKLPPAAHARSGKGGAPRRPNVLCPKESKSGRSSTRSVSSSPPYPSFLATLDKHSFGKTGSRFQKRRSYSSGRHGRRSSSSPRPSLRSYTSSFGSRFSGLQLPDDNSDITSGTHITSQSKVKSLRFFDNPVEEIRKRYSQAVPAYNHPENPVLRPSSAVLTRRPFYSSLIGRKQDPVSRFHSYQRSWQVHAVPGENARRILRWNIKTAMMHREVPLLQRNHAEASRLLGPGASVILERERKRRLKALQLEYVPPTSRHHNALRWGVRTALGQLQPFYNPPRL